MVNIAVLMGTKKGSGGTTRETPRNNKRSVCPVIWDQHRLHIAGAGCHVNTTTTTALLMNATVTVTAAVVAALIRYNG